MYREVRWLAAFAQRFDSSVRQRFPNGRWNYCLVVFGGRNSQQGRVIRIGQSSDCGSASDLGVAVQKIRLGGRNEDGYAGIDRALEKVSCGNGNRGSLQVSMAIDR